MRQLWGGKMWPQIPHSQVALYMSRAERFTETRFSETWVDVHLYILRGGKRSHRGNLESLKLCSTGQQNPVMGGWGEMGDGTLEISGIMSCDHELGWSGDRHCTHTRQALSLVSHQWGTGSRAPTPDCWTIGSWQTLGQRRHCLQLCSHWWNRQAPTDRSSPKATQATVVKPRETQRKHKHVNVGKKLVGKKRRGQDGREEDN